MSAQTPGDCHIYIGTHAEGADEGIHSYRFAGEVGALEETGLYPLPDLPSFQVLHPSGRFLYSANRAGAAPGRILAFVVAAQSGELTPLNEQPSHGPGPCHVHVTPDGAHLLVANYVGSTVAVLPVRPDGSLAEASHVLQHEGSSVHPRQQAPHPHGIYASPDGRHVVVPDLGTDTVVVYRLAQGRLAATPAGGSRLTPGSGPRHFAFHPGGMYGYVINELSSTITAFQWHAGDGMLDELETISTLPAGFQGSSSCAEIFVHPSGRWLYGSNRGHDSICTFAVDEATGRLELLGHVASGGAHPRYFGLDPSGTYLLAANMESHNVVSFRIDPKSGLPAATGAVTQVPSPVCMVMVPA